MWHNSGHSLEKKSVQKVNSFIVISILLAFFQVSCFTNGCWGHGYRLNSGLKLRFVLIWGQLKCLMSDFDHTNFLMSCVWVVSFFLAAVNFLWWFSAMRIGATSCFCVKDVYGLSLKCVMLPSTNLWHEMPSKSTLSVSIPCVCEIKQILRSKICPPFIIQVWSWAEWFAFGVWLNWWLPEVLQ